jgi:hypothetical protein
MEVPADGAAQVYVIKLIGPNANCFGVALPMTDLPFEVYEGTFVMPYPTPGTKEIRRLAFQARPGVDKVAFTGAGNMRVFDSKGQVVADNAPAGGAQSPKSSRATPGEVQLTPKPGQTYWLDPGNAHQFQTAKGSPKVHLTFDPQRWFHPEISWDLESRPWWKGIIKE